MSLILACTLLLAPSASLAQQADADAAPSNSGAGLSETEATRQASDQGLLRLNEVLSRAVWSGKDQKLGRASDMVIDLERKQAAFVLLAFGEWFRTSGEVVALPFAAIKLQQALGDARQPDRLAADITRQDLERMRTFPEDDLPDITSRRWALQSSDQFGYEPYWSQVAGPKPPQEAQPQSEFEASDGQRQSTDEAAEGDQPAQPANELQTVTATSLLEKPVQGPDQLMRGRVVDLIVDMREGRVVYALVASGQALGLGGRFVIVPFAELTFDRENEVFALNASQQTLRGLSFAPDNWPNLTDEAWAAQLHEQFDREPYWQVFGYGGYTRPGVPAANEEQIRQMLQKAGLPADRIDQLADRAFPITGVREAVEQAQLDAGLSQQEAELQAESITNQLEKLKRQGAGESPSPDN
jgi:sporulation protein YlmC with PRC-barrel domain